jgi:hypothetical protein
MFDSITIPPSADTVRRFFRERRPSKVAEVATLVGWTHAQVKRRAVEEDALLHDDLVRWNDVAAWLLESWPRRWLLDALGDEGHLLPPGLHLVVMSLEVPRYLARAYDVQWRVEPLPHLVRRPDTLSDYMADFLHRSMETYTFTLMRRDGEFRAACEYPRGDDDE